MEFIRQPWGHQLEALRRQALLPRPPQEASYALFFEPGAGKTGTAINIWRARCNTEKRFLRTLIFCPPIVVPNWRNEFELNSKVPREKVQLLTGPGKNRVKRFRAEAFSPNGVPLCGVYVTNFESLLMKDLFTEFRAWQPEAIIFDESHELKNYKAKRSQAAERLANAGPGLPFKQILTGSPVLKDAMDLFQQFLILDGGLTLGHNFFAFQARYFRDRNAGMPRGPQSKYFPNWELMTLKKDGFDGAEALQKAIAHKSMAVKKADCMDLPPFIQTTILVPMGPEQERLYGEMKRDFITYLDDKACVATMALTKILRLLQISSGYLKSTDGEEVELEDAPKAEALSDLLQTLTPHSKVLVWATWRNNYAQIRKVCEQLKIKYVEIHGEISEAKRNEAVEAINHDPSTRVLIGHPGSAGVGINLVAASYSVFYSRTFSLKHSIQAEARNYRGGSQVHLKVTRYDLVTENSIEELVVKKLQEKIELSEAILKDVAEALRSEKA